MDDFPTPVSSRTRSRRGRSIEKKTDAANKRPKLLEAAPCSKIHSYHPPIGLTIAMLDGSTFGHILERLHPWDVMSLFKSGDSLIGFKIRSEWTTFEQILNKPKYHGIAPSNMSFPNALIKSLSKLRTIHIHLPGVRWFHFDCCALPSHLSKLVLSECSVVLSVQITKQVLHSTLVFPSLTHLEICNFRLPDSGAVDPAFGITTAMFISQCLKSAPILLTFLLTDVTPHLGIQFLVDLPDSLETLAVRSHSFRHGLLKLHKWPPNLTSLTLNTVIVNLPPLPPSVTSVELCLQYTSCVAWMKANVPVTIRRLFLWADRDFVLRFGTSEDDEFSLVNVVYQYKSLEDFSWSFDNWTDDRSLLNVERWCKMLVRLPRIRRLSESLAICSAMWPALYEKGVQFTLPMIDDIYMVNPYRHPAVSFHGQAHAGTSFPLGISHLTASIGLIPNAPLIGLRTLHLSDCAYAHDRCIEYQERLPVSLTELKLSFLKYPARSWLHPRLAQFLPHLQRFKFYTVGRIASSVVCDWINGLPLSVNRIKFCAHQSYSFSLVKEHPIEVLKLSNLRLPHGLVSFKLELYYSRIDPETAGWTYPPHLERLTLKCREFRPLFTAVHLSFLPKSTWSVQLFDRTGDSVNLSSKTVEQFQSVLSRHCIVKDISLIEDLSM